MSQSDRARRALIRAVSQADQSSYETASMGKLVNGLLVYEVRGKPDWVWVTKSDQTFTSALNRGAVPLQWGLQVKMRLEAVGYVIHGWDRARQAPGTVPSSPYGVPAHPLNEHTDANFPAPADGDAILWDDASGKWVAGPPSGLTDTDDLPEGSTNLYYTAERARDDVGAALVGGTGVTVTVNDGLDTITIASTITQYTDENARDAIGTALVAGTGMTVTVNDGADTITLATTITQYTDELAQDAVGAAFAAGTQLGATVTYNDAGNSISIDAQTAGDARYAPIAKGVTNGDSHDHNGGDGGTIAYSSLSGTPSIPTQYTDEMAQDAVGAMATNSSTVTLAYVDATPSLTATVIDGSITNAKLANMTGPTIKGKASGTGAPEDLTTAQLIAIIEAGVIYAILAGRSGGQSLRGDTASGGNLTLMSTFHATKGKILFGNSAYDEANNRLGINMTSPLYPIDITLTLNGSQMHFSGTNADSGGYFTSVNASNFFMSGGMAYTNTGWVAKSTSAAAYGVQNGQHAWQGDTGLTAGVGFTPTTLMRLDDTGLGVGPITSPAAKLDVLQPTLGSLVQRLSSTATNDDPTEDKLHGRVTTTNNTATTIVTVPITANYTYTIEAEVIARRTGGTGGTANDGAGGVRKSVYATVGGVVTLIGSIASSFVDTGGVYGFNLVISGTNVLVQINGQTNANVVWHAFVTVKRVSS